MPAMKTPSRWMLISVLLAAAASARDYFGVAPGALECSKARIQAGDSILRPAFEALVKEADKALAVDPPSVTCKSKLQPGITKNDYCSQAPYFWPDPSKPDGLPYIPRDGEVNPESRTEASDQHRAEILGGTVSTLALAYAFTGRESYAEHAARCLKVWFIDPETRMNPQMEYAQFVPGLNTGRGIGIIEAGGIVEAADASALLAGSKAWSGDDDAALLGWADKFHDWLLTSRNGKAEAAEKQNHGTMFDVRVSRLALMLGKIDEVKTITETAREKRIAMQIEPDGRQPMELRRTKSFNYSRLNLRGLAELAVIAGRVGVDLWHFETPDGRSIRKAIGFMEPYVRDESLKWPTQQIVPIIRSELAVVFRQASIAYHEPRYEKVAADLPGSDRARFQLLHPLPPSDKQPSTP